MELFGGDAVVFGDAAAVFNHRTVQINAGGNQPIFLQFARQRRIDAVDGGVDIGVGFAVVAGGRNKQRAGLLRHRAEKIGNRLVNIQLAVILLAGGEGMVDNGDIVALAQNRSFDFDDVGIGALREIYPADGDLGAFGTVLHHHFHHIGAVAVQAAVFQIGRRFGVDFLHIALGIGGGHLGIDFGAGLAGDGQIDAAVGKQDGGVAAVGLGAVLFGEFLVVFLLAEIARLRLFRPVGRGSGVGVGTAVVVPAAAASAAAGGQQGGGNGYGNQVFLQFHGAGFPCRRDGSGVAAGGSGLVFCAWMLRVFRQPDSASIPHARMEDFSRLAATGSLKRQKTRIYRFSGCLIVGDYCFCAVFIRRVSCR